MFSSRGILLVDARVISSAVLHLTFFLLVAFSSSVLVLIFLNSLQKNERAGDV